MKPRLSQLVGAEQGAKLVSAAVAAWYAAHSSVRSLWAVRGANELRVFVTLEPSSDSAETLPVWLANRLTWARELQFCTDQSVRLERLDEPVFEGAAIGAQGPIVVSLHWRDPSFI